MTDRILCVTGATGFIGRHLLRRIRTEQSISLRCLMRDETPACPGAVAVRGDLRDPRSLERLIVPGATVINLAFLGEASAVENSAAATALARACSVKGAARLVHVSTATVAGRNPADVIDESSPCMPATPYERIKLDVERILLDSAASTEVVALRPTAVFGEGGLNLLKLARATASASALHRYLAACFHGRRPMNLVSADMVAGAIAFFALDAGPCGREVFLVSEDDVPENNYRHVEAALIRAFHMPDHPVPVVAAPAWMRRHLLRMRGRSNINTERRYSARKLQALGFSKPVGFGPALEGYCRHLAGQFMASGRVTG